jgi:ABC-type dipeptide/oligopeptide/nickel transport system permease subunit
MRLIDLMLAFPSILLSLAISAVLGPRLFHVMLAVGISATPTYARVSRSSGLQVKEEPFVKTMPIPTAVPEEIPALAYIPHQYLTTQ